eukprot:2041083-Rhodomonas_salina.1
MAGSLSCVKAQAEIAHRWEEEEEEEEKGSASPGMSAEEKCAASLSSSVSCVVNVHVTLGNGFLVALECEDGLEAQGASSAL